MTWFKIDDNFALHPKVLRAGNAAIGLWARAGAWSAQQLTDGCVPAEIVPVLGGTQADADALVRAELWIETLEGYEFHDWADRQPTRESVLEKRDATRQRVADWRERKRESKPARNAVTHPVSNAVSNASPDPTRPDPKERARSSAPSTRGTRLPDDWDLDDKLRAYTLEHAPSVTISTELENFRDYWASVAGAKGVKRDWGATWRTWVRRSHDRALERGWKPSSSTKDTQTKLDTWLAARGVSRETYERRKSETGWLEGLREITE